MIIHQLSVFIENKPGRLKAIIDILADHKINISALSLADTAEFGILRLIVDQPEQAKTLLNDSGVVVRINQVIAVGMEDVPGGAAKIICSLSENNINIEYMYACIGRVTGKALMVLRTNDIEKSDEVLHTAGFGDINPSDIYRI